MMRIFGLIGFPLGHSFSKKYFTAKFEKENIQNAQYELFELASIQQFTELIRNNKQISGLNVTIPYKKEVIPFLDDLDESAKNAQAVNVIKFEKNGKLIGYNSDFYGFRKSLEEFLEGTKPNALILGNGGSAGAVKAALDSIQIDYKIVSRDIQSGDFVYTDLNEKILSNYHLIINTTPLGMYPKVENCPEIPYQFLNSSHYIFDLIYNPEETLLMKKAKKQGSKTKSGLQMLHCQAENAWEIWNQE